MSALRHVVRRVALVWLLCQAMSLSLAAATLWPGPLPVQLECSCVHADGAACPMHEGRRPGERRCAIGAAAAVPSTALTSVLDMGLLSAVGDPVVHAHVPVVDGRPQTARSLRPQPPDPPPPRA